MLKEIKSSFFSIQIFDHIDDGRKLNLIKCNKQLQKLLSININNYRMFSGKYIIYETNKIGKIFDANNDKLIYEGELLNGKKHGKGKEFNIRNGIISFDGEYLNGKEMEMVESIFLFIVVIFYL